MKIISTKRLLASGFHLGKSILRRNPAIIPYLSNRRQGLDYYDLSKSWVMLKRVLRILHNLTQVKINNEIPVRILFVGSGNLISTLLPLTVPKPHGYIKNRWVAGILDDWNIKVHEPLQTYYSQPNFICTKAHQNRYDFFLKGLAPIIKVPDLVIFINGKESEIGLKECWESNIPTIALLDSTCDPTYATYIIPINTDNVVNQWLIYSLILDRLSTYK